MELNTILFALVVIVGAGWLVSNTRNLKSHLRRDLLRSTNELDERVRQINRILDEFLCVYRPDKKILIGIRLEMKRIKERLGDLKRSMEEYPSIGHAVGEIETIFDQAVDKINTIDNRLKAQNGSVLGSIFLYE